MQMWHTLQASGNLGVNSAMEAQVVLARVREALPTLREAADVGIAGKFGDGVEIGPRRCLSSEGTPRATEM